MHKTEEKNIDRRILARAILRIMVSYTRHLTLEEFLALPETDVTYEYINGRAIPKMSPKFFHSRVQKTLLLLLASQAEKSGRIEPEWAVRLCKNNDNWIPVPDLTYISYERLSADWMLDEPCPAAPELVIEIVSPGQSFGDLAEKAASYLEAGISEVWIADPQARSITIFTPDNVPQTIRGETQIENSIFSDLKLTPREIFQQAGLPTIEES